MNKKGLDFPAPVFLLLLFLAFIYSPCFSQSNAENYHRSRFKAEFQINEPTAFQQGNIPGDSNIVAISQLFLHGNDISNVWISGNTAYALSNFGLLIFDIANIASPQLTGYWGNQSSWTHDPRNLIVQDNYAYIVDRESGFIIIDVSDNTRPVLCSYYELNGFFTGAVDIDIEKNIAFIAARRTGVLIFDVSNPFDPWLVATYKNLNDAIAIKVENNIAYIIDLGAGLLLIDVTDPANPAFLSQFKTTEMITSFDVANNYAYVAYLRNGVHIIDVGDPLNPQLVHDFQSGDYYEYIEVADSTAYVIVEHPAEIQVYNVADPKNPLKINDFATEGTSLEIFLVDKIGYIADGSKGIRIVDFSDPAEFKLIAEFFQAGWTHQLAYADPYLYVAESVDGLSMLDIQDPQLPTRAADFQMENFIETLKIKNNILYALFFNTKIQLFDLSSNPLQPQFLSQIYLTAESDQFDTDGNYLYWAKNWRGVHIYNISDKSNPKWISEIETKDKAYRVFVDSTLLYVADYEAGMQIYDIADPYQPALLGDYDSPGRGYDIVARDKHAFLADDSGLEIINVENPADPFSVFRVDSLLKVQRVYLSADLLYLSCQEYGIQVFDISDPNQPVLAGRYNTPGVAEDIFNIGDVIFIADRTSLGIYQLNYVSGNTFYSVSGRVSYYSNQYPMKNVPVRLSGSNSTRTVSTDETGAFLFQKLKPGNYVIKPLALSVDQQAISPYDASLILRNQVGLVDLDPGEKIAADVSHNGEITAYDASYVLRYCVGLIDSFPGDHQVVFVADRFALNDSNWISPADSIVCLNLVADRTDQNFSAVVIGDVSGNWQPGLTKAQQVMVTLKQLISHQNNREKQYIPIALETNEPFFSGRLEIQFSPGVKLLNAIPGASLSEALCEAQVSKNAINFAFASDKKITPGGEIVTLEAEPSSDSLSNVILAASLQLDEHSAKVTWSDNDLGNNRDVGIKYEMAQNYPNPFNAQSMIRFSLPEQTGVKLEIYNITGQKISTIIDEVVAAGFHSVQLNAQDFKSGIYFYSLKTDKFSQVKKMIVVR